MRVLRFLAGASLLAPLVLLAPSGAGPSTSATLRPGSQSWWGAGAARRDVDGAVDYKIAVRGGGHRLVVSFDHPDYRVPLYGMLIDPRGKHAGYLSGWNSGEAYVRSPRAGVWTLRMYAEPGYAQYRMRARLERSAPRPPRRPVPLLPNLRLVPPYEFTFHSPLTGSRYMVMGPRVPGQSCTVDDRGEQHGVRCLRFSVGPANVGPGPLQLEFPGENEGLVLPGKAKQILTWSDGRRTTREAGEFEYHKTHGHYHHSGFGKLELLKADPDTRELTPAGSGPKQGFCTADVMIADWSEFGSDQNSATSSCVEQNGEIYDPEMGTSMGLSAGWADLYSWEQDGNYVEFGANLDGHYVVRSTADALGNVLETNENDNTSYAYIQVTGFDIKVLERGRGQGPWDPRKVVVRDGLLPNAVVPQDPTLP